LAPASGTRETDMAVGARLCLENADGEVVARETTRDTATVTVEHAADNPSQYGDIDGSGSLTIKMRQGGARRSRSAVAVLFISAGADLPRHWINHSQTSVQILTFSGLSDVGTPLKRILLLDIRVPERCRGVLRLDTRTRMGYPGTCRNTSHRMLHPE